MVFSPENRTLESKAGGKDSGAAENRWDAALYDSRHSFVWKYAAELIELLAPRKGERILDVGCGTGHLAHQISLAGAEVIGLDHSPAMIEQARSHYPQLEFILADAASFQFAEPFDAVFSNAALHWVKPPDQAVNCIARALKPGGRFVAEFGGRGNLQSFHSALRRAREAIGCPVSPEQEPWYFPTIGEYTSLLEQYGLQVRQASFFDRPTPLEDGENGLRNWMEMFGSVFMVGLSPAEQQRLFRSFAEQLRPTQFRAGAWVADYTRIRIVALR